MERQQDYVLRSVEERGIRFIRLWFTVVLGQLKSIAIVPGELENAFDDPLEVRSGREARGDPPALNLSQSPRHNGSFGEAALD